MDLLNTYIPNFLFILLRAGIVLSLLPYFGSKTFPAQFKIGLAVAFAILLAPVVEFNVTKAQIPLVVMREVMFGLIFGLAARFIFFAVEMAGQVMSNAAGLSIASAFNPEIGQSTEVSRLYGIMATLMFFAMDIHHDLITIFVKSYEWLPSSPVDPGRIAFAAVSFASRIFVIALKLSAPVVIIMLIANLLMGFVYKAAPQMNVFFVGYPVYIVLGLGVMLLSLPVFAQVMGGYFNSIKDEMERVILLLQ